MKDSAPWALIGLAKSIVGLVGLAAGLLSASFLMGYTSSAVDTWAVSARQILETAQDQLDRPEQVPEELSASGVIQANQINLASELGGRIESIGVEAGGQVMQSDPLVQLNTQLVDAQINAARALVAVAVAGVDQANAGARPGLIRVGESQLAQAEVGLSAANQAVSDTLALVENPQDIKLGIAVTQAQIEAAQHRVTQANAFRDAAEIAKNTFHDLSSQWAGGGRQLILVASGSVADLPGQIPPEVWELLPGLLDGDYTVGNWELRVDSGTYELYRWINVNIPLELHLAPNQWWQAWVGVNAAEAQRRGLESSAYLLYQQLANPQSLESRLDAALSAQAQAEAQVAAAESQLAALLTGASPEALAALEARVDQAQAGVDALQSQREMMTLEAPISGTVLNLTAFPGEAIAPGSPILSMADLRSLHLTVFIPENRIGQVFLDQGVEISIDSFPGMLFAGSVQQIAQEAQYTPRNVATQEERVHLVFGVQIHVNNESGMLKPGMPADVRFLEEMP